jgi:hypothetical protein
VQQLLLGQQPLIQLIHPRQTLLDRRDHLLFQQGDFLFSIGLLDPGAPQRQPSPQLQDSLDRLEAYSSSRNGSSSGLQNAPSGAMGRQNGEAAAESMAMDSAPRAAQRRDRSQ